MVSTIRKTSLALILLALPAAASERPAAIEAMLSALGGDDSISSLRSLAVEARCTGPDGAFRTRVESFLPGATYFAQAADDGETVIWSTADRTWRRKSDGGIEDLSAGVRQFVRAHEFHLLLFQIDSRFAHHRAAGTGEWNGTPCRLVEMDDASGAPATVCVSDRDALPLYLELNPQGAAGPIRIVFRDWREVESLRYFFGFTLTEGPDRTFTYDYERIEHDGASALRFVAPAAASKQSEQRALLEILRSDRQAHLETDAERLVSNIADLLVDVSSGRVTVTPRAEIETMFAGMFAGARYRMWEDAQPPLIRIASDGSMAWVARTVRVRVESPGPDGRPRPREFTSAYTSTYAKVGETWKMTSVTSTFAA